MVLTREQIASLTAASRPLIEWLNENCHPHCEVNVTTTGATATEGLAHVVASQPSEKMQYKGDFGPDHEAVDIPIFGTVGEGGVIKRSSDA